MAVTGWKNCGTVTTTPSPGSAEDWDNVGSEYYSMNIYAGYSLTGYLKMTNFGFTTSDIPSGSTIDGVEFQLEKKRANGQVYDYFVKITTDSSTPTGTDQAVGTLWSTAYTETTYGGSSNTWGVSLTDSQVRSSNFGIIIQAYFNAYSGINFAYIHTGINGSIITQLRIYYTPPSTSSGIHYNDSGTWRDITQVYYNDSGTWRTITTIYYNDSGTWRELG
jgi:hypothetical protein